MKVFVAGPRSVVKLDECVKKRLQNVMENNFTVLVGDANGVDRIVQDYLHSSHYIRVLVYASAGKPRNNIGSWPIVSVDAGKKKGFEFYAAKDKRMAEDSDYGFMIWNGKSKGTMNNILNLTTLGKKTLVYLTKEKSFFNITNPENAQRLVNLCGEETAKLFNELSADKKDIEQIMLDRID